MSTLATTRGGGGAKMPQLFMIANNFFLKSQHFKEHFKTLILIFGS